MKLKNVVYFVFVILAIKVAAASPLAEPCSEADGREGNYNCKEVTTTSDGCSEGHCSHGLQQQQQEKKGKHS